MAYIGRGVDKISNIEVLDAITFTDSAGPYNLLKDTVAFTPTSPNALVISVDGVVQSPDSYTIASATITFDSVMAASSTMDFIYQMGVGILTAPSDGSVTAARLATDAVETAKIKDLNVTAGKLATDAVETAKIKDLNVTAGKLAATQDLSTKTITLPATVAGLGTGIDVTSQITGVVPTANLGSGSASASTYLAGNQTYQTITEYNDDALQNDIATLALHQATNANAAKYNLTNTNVDVYQDSTGIASFTDCSRDSSGEYVASTTAGGQTIIDRTAGTAVGTMVDNGGLAAAFDGDNSEAGADCAVAHTITTSYIGKDWGSGVTKTLTGARTYGATDEGYSSQGANSSGCTWDVRGGSTSVIGDSVSLGSLTNQNFRVISTPGAILNIMSGLTETTAYRYHFIKLTQGTTGHNYVAECEFYDNPQTYNATGNYVSTATTANASVSKVGIVITYKNNEGTNTLNTDIVAEVSANGGSNYTTCVLAAAGTFSTGVLQCVANDVSVTAGTSIQYRISFANQAEGSKEARITGASLIY